MVLISGWHNIKWKPAILQNMYNTKAVRRLVLFLIIWLAQTSIYLLWGYLFFRFFFVFFLFFSAAADYEAKLKAEQKELEALSPDSKKPKDLFSVQFVTYGPKKPDTARASDRPRKDKDKIWSEALAKDAVVAESVLILGDMLGK